MNFEYLKEHMDNLGETLRIPGRYIIVTHHGKRVFEYGAGYADEAKTKPFSSDTLVNLYSCSKPITCTAALQLLEKGKFLLEDPIANYLPAFKDMTVRHITKNGITEIRKAENPILIHQLFTMTAGLSYDLTSPSIQKAKENKFCTTQDFVNAIANEPLLFEPGTAYRYSLCHDVLGALIEVVSGMTFGEYLKKNIFEPLGMENTGFKATDAVYARMADQYTLDAETDTVKNIGKNNEFRFSPNYESGGAGLISCAEDYIRFVTAMSLFGKSPEDAKILSKSTINMMRATHVIPTELGAPNMGVFGKQGYNYGLGVRTAVGSTCGRRIAPGEFGWDGAAGCFALMDPDEEIAIFYAQHRRNPQMHDNHPRIRNMVYAQLVK